jgi:BirA family biotin operon repressor/biotin-[acetyl-CoA-carboxylase] ligase
VRLLMDHATVVVSGTKIAEEIGTTRSEVWRLVQQLRGLGVDIAGHSATGYRLRRVPDLLLAETLAPLLRGTMFAAHIHHYFKCGSTNLIAMEAATAGAAEGSVFLAEEQVAGRGRGGHSWHSARSQGIYCSVVLRPALSPADVLILMLAAGLAAAAAVEQLLARIREKSQAPPQVDLRWPNDLLLNGKKFAGILAELTAEATRVRHLVLGIGINVNQPSFPADLRDLATSLRVETGNCWSRVELTAALLKSLDREYRALGKAGAGRRESVLRRFQERSSYVQGRRVRVEEDGGYEGITAGLDARGFLQVETPSGLRTVLSGGVRALD